MKSEDPLRALATLPRPRLSPFFPARVAARAAEPRELRAGSRLMRLYWFVLACAAATGLAGTWGGVAVLLVTAAAAAFPGLLVRFLVAVAAGLVGRRSPCPGFQPVPRRDAPTSRSGEGFGRIAEPARVPGSGDSRPGADG